jgi:hypothetical protein
MTVRRGMSIIDLLREADAVSPPARPVLSLAREPGDGFDAVELRGRVPAGLSEPVRFRLRRSRAGMRDLHGMPVVAEGDLPASRACAPPLMAVHRSPEGTELVLRDAGPMQPWEIVSWVVEVQGRPAPDAPAIDGDLVGAWSLPSKRASFVAVPNHAPTAPSAVTGARSACAITLTIVHPGGASLLATPMGAFAFEIYRASEGRPVRLDLPVHSMGGVMFTAVDARPPAGAAVYAVRLVDPIGRPGAFAMSHSL